MERNCVTTFVVASEFANDGGVLGLEPSLVGRASWTWACWPGFDIVWVSVEVATAVPKEGQIDLGDTRSTERPYAMPVGRIGCTNHEY